MRQKVISSYAHPCKIFEIVQAYKIRPLLLHLGEFFVTIILSNFFHFKKGDVLL